MAGRSTPSTTTEKDQSSRTTQKKNLESYFRIHLCRTLESSSRNIMAKRLLQHATFAGAARKKARLLQEGAAASCTAAAAAAAFFSNSKPTMMKAEPWDAAGHDLSFPFVGCNGSHGQRPSSSAGPVRRDHGINRRNAAGSNQKFTTVPYYDGHEWRKYGEKTISGLDFPRCYYRCTYSPCPAKKRVEQIGHDYPPMYLVTYQKEHTCNASTTGADSAVETTAAAMIAPKVEPLFIPFASQVRESIIVEQKRFPSTPSTTADGSCRETCSPPDQPTLREISSPESMEMINYDELTDLLACSLPDLPILSDLVELESMDAANHWESSITPSRNGYARPSLDQPHWSDLATLELMDVTAKYKDSSDSAGADDAQGFLAGEEAAACSDTSYLEILGQLKFDEEDALNPMWSW